MKRGFRFGVGLYFARLLTTFAIPLAFLAILTLIVVARHLAGLVR